MSATSSAAPDRLTGFATAHDRADVPLAVAVVRLAVDLAAFVAGAGPTAPAATGAALAALLDLRAETAHVATWVAGVGEAFRRAGADPDGDGTFTVDGARLPALGPSTRVAWLDLLAGELATLATRDRGRSLDAATVAALLADARRLVGSAPDPQAEAARLLARVGAADVAAAVDLLAGAADGAGDRDGPAVAALADLGVVVSAGLERQPERAARWAERLTAPLAALALVGAPRLDGLALLGGGNAPGTAAFGVALAAGLSSSGLSTSAGGPVRRLYGTSDPLGPTLVAAASRRPDGRFTQVPLAHGVVADLARRDHGRGLLASFSAAAEPPRPAPGSTLDPRAEALRAAVDPSVPEADRVRVALDLTERFTATPTVTSLIPGRPGGAEPWSPPVTQAFGAATRPLLARWVDTGDGGEVRWRSGPGVVTAVDDRALWDQVGALALSPAGADGVGEALVGASADRLAASTEVGRRLAVAGLADPGLDPLTPGGLRAIGTLEARVVGAVGEARFDAIADAAQGPTGRAARLDAARTIALGGIGEVPGGSAAAGLLEGFDRLGDVGPRLAFAGSPTTGLHPAVTTDLVVANLARHPHLATREVVDALASAAAESTTGVYELVHDDAAALRLGDGGPLAELQARVATQEAAIAAGRTDALAALLPGGGS